ncbi:protein mono-ADP-ribosyltransferase PARP12-like [Aplochiton taeniatus]
MTTAVPNFAIKKLCENQGCMDFKQLDQIIGHTFTVDDVCLLDILSNDGHFAIRVGKEKALRPGMSPDSVIVAKTALRVCQSPPGKCLTHQCANLHLCRYFVCGNCRFGNKCKNTHSLDSPNNMFLLRGVGLQDLKEDELFHLLLQNDPYLLPEVCSHYNRGISEHGMCRFNTTCTNLHLCLHFLKDDCRFGPACKRAHTLNDQATKVLTGRGFSPKNMQNLNKIYRNKFIILGEVPAAVASPASAGPPVVRERIHMASVGSSTPSSSAPSAPGSSPISEAERNEICLFFIRRHCSFKEKCVRVHYHLPYKWQVLDRDGGTWEDLPNMEVIEKAYCDPGKSTSDGDLLVNFVTMRCDGREVRRLSTASSVTKPPHFVLTTQWLWYWEDELDQWHQYGQEAGGHSASSITSKTLENVYLADTVTDIQFKAGKHSYVLSFKGSYFARDAVYSHAYAKSQTTRKKMFVALVLVGEFVKGNRSYRKPPAKGTSNIRYDSCVDREARPSIFVVFEKQQICPEYVIDYS